MMKLLDFWTGIFARQNGIFKFDGLAFGFAFRQVTQSKQPLQPLPFRYEADVQYSAPSHVGLRQQTIRTVYHVQVSGEDERQRLWPSSRR